MILPEKPENMAGTYLGEICPFTVVSASQVDYSEKGGVRSCSSAMTQEFPAKFESPTQLLSPRTARNGKIKVFTLHK